MSTETQTVDTQQQPVAEMENFLPGAQRVAQPIQPQDPVVQADKPVDTAAPEAQPTADPYEAALEQAMEQPAQVVLDDAFKATFKNLYGHEDPLAYKTEVETKLTQSDLIKAEYDKLLPLQRQLEAMPPSLKRAYQLAMEGKAQEAQEFLRGLPDGVFLNKAAKDIPSEQLIGTYLKDKMSKEDFAALKDPETDPDVLSAIKTKEKHFRDIAADMHERQREDIDKQVTGAQDQQRLLAENYSKGVAEAISIAKNDPLLKAHVDQSIVDSFRTGQWMNEILRDDGVTPSLEAVRMLLRAKHYEPMMKAQYNVGYKKGRNEGMLEANSVKPGAPPTNGRTVAAPTQQQQSAADQILSRLGMG